MDYGPQTPMKTTTVATAVQRRWACHTRTVLPTDAYGRQRCNVVLCMFCCLPVVYVLGCVLVREGNKNRQFFTGTYVQNRRLQRNPGNRLIHSRKKKNFERPPRELQCSDRAQTSTTGSGRPSCVDVVLWFWLKVLVRTDKFENRRKFHKYTYTYTTVSLSLIHI